MAKGQQGVHMVILSIGGTFLQEPKDGQQSDRCETTNNVNQSHNRKGLMIAAFFNVITCNLLLCD